MRTRILSGIVGIALATAVIQYGGTPFSVAALLLAILGWREYVAAFRHKGLKPLARSGYGVLIILLLGGMNGDASHIGFHISIMLFLLLIELVLYHGKTSVEGVAVSIMGVFYIGWGFLHLLLLRSYAPETLVQTFAGEMTLGTAFLWVMFLGTWSSDSFAYFAGYAFGKHKLASRISPKKTIEGCIGGFIGTTLVVTALGIHIGMPIRSMAALGVAICAFATIGDLVESVIKRHTGIKDSGTLIPGHGGVLDRFDSVLFTAPLVYYFLLMSAA